VGRKERNEYIAREFDRAAKSYDDSRFVNSYQRRTQTLTINTMHIEKGMNILDLGCGTGRGTIDIAEKLEGSGKIVGLDLSEAMVRKARQNLAGFQYTNVEFQVGSGNTLDIENQFDFVLSTNAFHHFDKKEEIFARVRKSLKHNGVFVIEDVCNDYFQMKMVDVAGKISGKAHIGSTTSEGLRNLFLTTDYTDVEVTKIKFNWFWGIMIGRGTRK
jgi:ubiquinone/menaquinone biosynthesis C-methylase UbiE